MKELMGTIEKYQLSLPFKQKLKLLYQKDDWANINQALIYAEKKITDQSLQSKEEKETYRTILETISENIIAIDLHESILFTNKVFEQNFIDEANIKGIIKKLWHVFPDYSINEIFKKTIETGKEQELKEIYLKNLKNESLCFDIYIKPLMSSNGQIKGALGVLKDITEQIKTHRMRVDFVANISHEIKTPLTSLMGFSQVLFERNTFLNREDQILIEKILTNSRKINSLFSDLLHLSVIENKILASKQSVTIEDLLFQTIENLKKIYQHKSILLETHLDQKDIFVDEQLFEQVFNNLLDNAIKYSLTDQVLIEIRSFSENDKDIIKIRDNGPGIPEDLKSRIFERFYRINESRHIASGTGLGLSIVKNIIQKHNAEISVSGWENGLEIKIELPKN